MLQPGRRPRTLHRRAHRQRPARMARPGGPQAAARLCPAGPAHAGECPLQRTRTPRPGAGQAVADRLGEHRGAPGDAAERPLHGLPRDVRRSPGGACRRHRRGLSPGALGSRRAARQGGWRYMVLRDTPEQPGARHRGRPGDAGEALARARRDARQQSSAGPAARRPERPRPRFARSPGQLRVPAAVVCRYLRRHGIAPLRTGDYRFLLLFPRAPGRNTRSRWWTGCANSSAGTTTMRR